jgi:hypothetical protein
MRCSFDGHVVSPTWTGDGFKAVSNISCHEASLSSVGVKE